MNKYHKIRNIFKRNEKGKLIHGSYTIPEFAYLASLPWDWTEKVDGMNVRIMFDGNQISFAGKTDRAQIPSMLSDSLIRLFGNIDIFKKNFSDGVCLYGEGYGKKIQGGGKYLKNTNSFVLFDVKIGHWWLQREAVKEIAELFGIITVPYVGCDTISEAIALVRDGFKSAWGDFTAEGIVARPCYELFFRNGERAITKLKHKDFRR